MLGAGDAIADACVSFFVPACLFSRFNVLYAGAFPPRQFRPRGGSPCGSVSALIGIRLWSFLSLGHELC